MRHWRPYLLLLLQRCRAHMLHILHMLHWHRLRYVHWPIVRSCKRHLWWRWLWRQQCRLRLQRRHGSKHVWWLHWGCTRWPRRLIQSVLLLLLLLLLLLVCSVAAARPHVWVVGMLMCTTSSASRPSSDSCRCCCCFTRSAFLVLHDMQRGALRTVRAAARSKV
jgi:hypothetical protein